MTSPTNREIYGTVEFERWAFLEKLFPEERYVIERYLERNADTLEAGTGGGRILLNMREMGFQRLRGFDFVPELIEEARRRDASGAIRFEAQDATALPYPDDSAEQLIYLQQILCFIPEAEGRAAAAEHAARILKPGGTAVFSFLCHEVARTSLLHRAFLGWLRFVRFIRRSRRSLQSVPWMRLGNRPNFGALIDRGPYVHWFKVREAAELLIHAGLSLHALGTSRQIADDRMCASAEELLEQPLAGGLYVVCRKPQAAVT